jgi:hypothetical protein
MYQTPYKPRPPESCAECGFLDDCGGLEGKAYAKGCFARCVEHCQYHGCDVACPCLHLNFPDLLEEAGGLWAPPERELTALISASTLPYYIAQIDHGGSRDAALREEIVAVPLSALVGRVRRGWYDVRFDSPAALRHALKLSEETDIIVSSVAPDQVLEDFWEEHVARDILPRLALLRLRAMTVPNFSFMTDVTRLNSLRNLSRMFRVAERISGAGIATILHLQASTRHDWGKWTDVLRAQSSVATVALEFQTGPKQKEIGDRYYCGLVGLQDSIGRSLHPLVIAGGGRMRQMKTHFRSFTVIDSTPFIKTMKRRLLIRIGPGRWKWRRRFTSPKQSLSQRLVLNVNAHRRRFHEIIGIIPDLGNQRFLFPPAA